MIHHADILVIGAGPAGIAAATAAAQNGRSTILLDDNPTPGGQIWRTSASQKNKSISAKQKALHALNSSGARLLLGRRVVDAPHPEILHAVADSATGPDLETFAWNQLIIATGARERFLPFPGWTLPGVFGAGGLQALVKGGYAISGKRVLVAGSGPMLLAVAAYLQHHGAIVVAIAEQAPLASLLRFASSLCASPSKLFEAALYTVSPRTLRFRSNCWPVAAEGDASLRAVHLTNGKRTWTVPCDLLACGFNLVPNTELAALLGCAFDGDFVHVDKNQQTSIANLYCVGEPVAIAGLDAALLQGEIAGLVAAGQPQQAAALYARRDKQLAFARNLDSAFKLRNELRTLAAPDTIVCRCEDVRYSKLQSHSSWTQAKLATRCGMGPCQGRVCGPAVQTLFNWRPSSIRPPIFPAPLALFNNEDDTISSEPNSQELS